MKFLTNALLLSAIPLVLTGCLTSDKDGSIDDSGEADADADSDADADADADSDSDADADTAIWEIEVGGEAAINSTANSWTGTEDWTINDLTNNELLCAWSSETASNTPINTCTECTFAYHYTYANGVGTGGDCSQLMPTGDGEIPDWDRKLGFAPNYTDSQGNEAENVVLGYYDGSGGSAAAGWYPYSYANGGGWADNGDGTGTFTYEWAPWQLEYPTFLYD
jgi:hypothetical protein